MTSALQACAAHDLLFDFALGPNQGQGVPSAPKTPGLAKEFVYRYTTVASRETFDDNIPGSLVEFT